MSAFIKVFSSNPNPEKPYRLIKKEAILGIWPDLPADYPHLHGTFILLTGGARVFVDTTPEAIMAALGEDTE